MMLEKMAEVEEPSVPLRAVVRNTKMNGVHRILRLQRKVERSLRSLCDVNDNILENVILYEATHHSSID